MAKKKIGLSPNPRNPRRVTDKKLKMLQQAMTHHGDMGGIVFNRRSGLLISGHQRVAASGIDDSAITITREHKKPTAAGTVAEGYVTINSERFAYRIVDIDDRAAALASLASNKNAGDFDMPMLADEFRELQGWDAELDLSMFSVSERAFAMDQQPDVEADDEQAQKDQSPNRCPSCGHEWIGSAKGG